MRQLLMGPAGTGKTRRVLEIIQDYLARGEGHKLLVLLPTESLTSHFQALLLDNGRLEGFTGQFLFTFHRLSYFLISQQKNFTLARSHQQMLLLEEVLQKNCPPYFAQVKSHRGFRQALLKSFKELKEQAVELADFERITASLQGRWSGKSRERFYALIDLYKHYQKALQERSWGDGEDLLFQAAGLINEDAGILQEKELLIVDGFYSFTPQEKLILENLLKKLPQTLVTLTAPVKQGGIFEPVEQTLEFLAPHRLEKNTLEVPHRFAASALRIIAENFLAGGSTAKAEESAGGLEIWEAPDRHAEVEAVAQEIMYLVHARGFDFADIGIILRQPASYLTLFRETFNLLNIPWRYWGKEPLSASPEVKTALELGNLLTLGWERERVFRLLKSGYFDLELAEVDAWEQGAEQHPLENEKAWREFLASLNHPAEGIQDTGAKKVAAALMERAREFRGKNTGAAWAEKFRGVVEEFLLSGAIRAVGCSKQRLPLAALEKFLSMIKEVGRFWAQAEITFTGFLEALSLVVNAAEIFRPDPRRHAVNLIGVHEARQWELPVVFLVGLVEGEFPAPGREDLFIKDYQRKTLGESKGLNLPLSSTWAEEEMLFYFAATRAQEQLYLTYPTGGANRKDFLPSTFIEEVKNLFTAPAQEMPVTQLPPIWECPGAEKIYSAGALSLFILGHKNKTGAEGEAARWILTHDREHPWPRIVSLPQYRNILTGVPPEGMRGNQHIFSVSELEAFAQCPRAYFCQYILGLEPLALTYAEDLEYSFWGTLAHKILELYYRPALQNTAGSAARSAPAGISLLLEEVLAQTPEARAQNYLFLREKELLRRNLTGFLAREEARHLLYPFFPRALEWSFGKNTPPLIIETGDEAPLRLSGKIDRLDVGKEDQKCAVVVDYKYSRQGKNLKDRMEGGLELQLPLYILAVQELWGYKPAGGVLYYLKKSTPKPESFEDMATLGREGLWPSAFGGKKAFLLEEQPWLETMQQVKTRVRELVTRIQAGDIRPTPEQAEYCGSKKCQFFELCPLREREATAGGGEDNERD